MKKTQNYSLLGYDALAGSYDYVYGQTKHQELYTSLKWLNNKLKNGSRILDIGCGTGRVAKYLSKNFNVTGIDNAPQMIKVAKTTAPKAVFLEMNLFRLKFPDTQKFDALVCFFTLLHVEKSIFERIIRSLLQLLRKEGFFIISMVLGDYNKDANLMNKMFHYTAYEESDLLTIFENCGLKVLRVKKQRFRPRNDDAEFEDQIFIYLQL